MSVFSSSCIICKYVFCVVDILACPNRCATLAIDTPAYNNIDACVCLKPCIVITGISAFIQCLFKVSFIVELYIFLLINIGFSSSRPFIISENCITVCQSNCTFLSDDLFFVGSNPPFSL